MWTYLWFYKSCSNASQRVEPIYTLTCSQSGCPFITSFPAQAIIYLKMLVAGFSQGNYALIYSEGNTFFPLDFDNYFFFWFCFLSKPFEVSGIWVKKEGLVNKNWEVLPVMRLKNKWWIGRNAWKFSMERKRKGKRGWLWEELIVEPSPLIWSKLQVWERCI